jgi:hypothetical protein
VSLISHRGVSIEEIARLAGHASTRTTEVVYRRELGPMITTGVEIMDEVFGRSYQCVPARRSLASGMSRHTLTISCARVILASCQFVRYNDAGLLSLARTWPNICWQPP